jgi:TonB family protein
MLIPAIELLVLLTQTSTPVMAADELQLTHWQTARTGAQIETIGPLMRMSGGRGWTRTTSPAPALDFVLRLQYRLATADAAGAVIVRAWEDDRNAWPGKGYRIALPGSVSNGKDAIPLRAYSSSVKMTSTAPPIDRLDAEHWYELEIACIGNHITVRVDGGVAAEGDGTERASGTIGLEIDRGTVEFRGMRVANRPSQAWSTAVNTDGSFAGKNPSLKHEVKPRYPIQAMRDHLEGTVLLEAIVDETGSVIAVRVAKSARPDLDAEALGAAREWQFTPAMLDGHPVRVLVQIELAFRLHDRRFDYIAHAMPSGWRPASKRPVIVSNLRSTTAT